MKESNNDPALADVRQVIERGTAKVSLRDLEKKGYRQVKVLKAGDIDKLVHQAVLRVLAKRGTAMVDAEEREKFEKEAKAEYGRLLKEVSHANKDKTELAQRLTQLEEDKKEALKDLNAAEEKVAEQREKLLEVETRRQEAEARAKQLEKLLNDERAEIREERKRLAREKDEIAASAGKDDGRVRQLEAEKQSIIEKQLQNQQTLVQNYERQLSDLRRQVESASGSDERVKELERELAEARQGGGEQVARLEAMMSGLAKMIQERPAVVEQDHTALKDDLSKMFAGLNEKLSRRMVDDKGEVIDADEAAAAALTGMMLEEASGKKMETNIENVVQKEEKTTSGVKDKLAKLRSLRGGK